MPRLSLKDIDTKAPESLDKEQIKAETLTIINELDELHLKAYESSSLYKKKMKKYLDQKIWKAQICGWGFHTFLNSRMRLFSG